MRITRVTHDLINEIIEKIGSLSISSVDINDICKDKDCDEQIFDIKLDDDRLDTVIWNGYSLSLIRKEKSITIDSLRFHEVIII